MKIEEVQTLLEQQERCFGGIALPLCIAAPELARKLIAAKKLLLRAVNERDENTGHTPGCAGEATSNFVDDCDCWVAEAAEAAK